MRAYRHGSWGGSSGGSSGGAVYAGSSGGSSGGSYGGSSGGSSGGSYGGYAAPAYSSGMPIQSYRVINETPSTVGGEVITPSAATPAATDSTGTEKLPADAALLVVEVPAEAKVFVNGTETTSTGSQRRYLSRGLVAGKHYEFVVRIAVDRDGKTAEQTKVVSLGAGERTSVSFVEETATSLTLRVPADATVWLAGNATRSAGAVRHFETKTLRAGQAWRNYEIKVATVVDGREQVVSKTIDLAAGDRVELALDPAAAAVEATASLR